MGVKYMPSDGGSWTSVPSGDVYHMPTDNGSWQVVKKGYYMPSDNGTWTQFYTGSDPVTYVFYPGSGGSSLGTTSARGS